MREMYDRAGEMASSNPSEDVEGALTGSDPFLWPLPLVQAVLGGTLIT